MMDSAFNKISNKSICQYSVISNRNTWKLCIEFLDRTKLINYIICNILTDLNINS